MGWAWKDLGEGSEYYPNTLCAVPRELNTRVKLCSLKQLTSDGAIIYECHCWVNILSKDVLQSKLFFSTDVFASSSIEVLFLKFFLISENFIILLSVKYGHIDFPFTSPNSPMFSIT